MTFEEIVRNGIDGKATDIHLEPRLPITMRVHGELRRLPTAIDRATLQAFAEQILNEEQWDIFESRGSVDLCRRIAGVQCRINILRTDRGMGFAIRLLATNVNTLRNRNLHPSLAEFLKRDSGLILMTGPTGSGKSTTLAALLEEINTNENRHIITLESPIEYRLTPRKSMVRQREVGLHTPSYTQGLLDSLREDPDVLVVGEMREQEAIQRTLGAAETGHLVLATMHSATGMDAIYRVMMSFPAERQSSVLAQLADTLIAIVSQKMTYRAEIGLMVPCLEILVATHAVKNVIRKGEVSKLISMLQAGGPDGMYTFERYQSWLDQRTDWVLPPAGGAVAEDDGEPDDVAVAAPSARRRSVGGGGGVGPRRRPRSEDEGLLDEQDYLASSGLAGSEPEPSPLTKKQPRREVVVQSDPDDGRIEIPEIEEDLNELVKRFK